MKQISTTSNESSMNTLIAALTILTVALSFVSLSVSYVKTNQMKEKITGNAVGYINITIQTIIDINISPRDVNWGTGVINTSGGWRNATLITGTGSDGNVSCGACGNWSNVDNGEGQNTKGLNLTNMGTVNTSLAMVSNIKSAHAMFGGSPAYEAYMWKATNGEPNSCAANLNNTWQNITGESPVVCSNLGFADDKDQLLVDIYMRVPYDANVTSQRETRTDVLTFSASAVTG